MKMSRKEWSDSRELADTEWKRAFEVWEETRHLDENVAWELVSGAWELYVYRIKSSPMPY